MKHRMPRMILQHRSRGASLIVVLIALTVVSFAVAAMFLIFASNNKSLNNQMESKKMYYYARSGINIAEAAIVNQGDTVFKGLTASPGTVLTDTIDRTKLVAEPDPASPFSGSDFLPEDIEIKISVEYLTKAKAEAILPPEPGQSPKYEGFLKIESEAKRKPDGKTYLLIKYLDPSGIQSQYE